MFAGDTKHCCVYIRCCFDFFSFLRIYFLLSLWSLSIYLFTSLSTPLFLQCWLSHCIISLSLLFLSCCLLFGAQFSEDQSQPLHMLLHPSININISMDRNEWVILDVSRTRCRLVYTVCTCVCTVLWLFSFSSRCVNHFFRIAFYSSFCLSFVISEWNHSWLSMLWRSDLFNICRESSFVVYHCAYHPLVASFRSNRCDASVEELGWELINQWI